MTVVRPERRPGTGVFSFAQRPPDAAFAVGVEARSWGDLLSDAASVSRRLPVVAASGPESGNVVMVACNDRYVSAVALLAAWHAGYVAALPPNGSPTAIDALCAAEAISLVLHDGGGAGGLDLRPLLGSGDGSGPTLPGPRFDADRTVLCVYTSGSTGQPLACRKTAAQIFGEAQLLVRLFQLGPDIRILATVPPCISMDCCSGCWYR